MRLALLAAAAVLLAIPVPARAVQRTVKFTDTAFSPSTVQLQPGDDVFWCGESSNEKTHSITADDGSFTRDVPPHSGCTWLTFPDEGRFPYHCRFVSGMTGTVIVGDTTPAPTTSAPRTTAPPSTAPRVTVATAAPGVTTTRPSTRPLAATTSSSQPARVLEVTVVPGTTTSTRAQLAINEQTEPDGGSGRALALLGVLGAIAAGAGYVLYRGRQMPSRWN